MARTKKDIQVLPVEDNQMQEAFEAVPASKNKSTEVADFELTAFVDNQDKTVGFILKKTREKRKKDIQKIADALRIRVRYLEALEESRYKDFPGQAYAFGFLRNYADFLGLDVDALIEQYRKETSFIKQDVLDMPIPERPVLFPSPKYLFWSILVVALVWAFWYFLTYSNTEQVSAPPILVAEEPLVEEQVAVVNGTVLVADAPVVEAVVTAPVAEAVAPVVAAAPVKKGAVQIVAKEEVWVEIEQDDTLILSRTLKKGEVYDVPTSDTELFLKTGNAGGMDILVEGQKIKSLGPVGAVRSGISLSADKLKNR